MREQAKRLKGTGLDGTGLRYNTIRYLLGETSTEDFLQVEGLRLYGMSSITDYIKSYKNEWYDEA